MEGNKQDVVNAEPIKAEEEVKEVETGVTPDVKATSEEVKEETPVSTENKLSDDQIEEYSNKYDDMVKENEGLKSQLKEREDKYSELEKTVKDLQEGMAKLRKANEFASSRNSNQQNQQVEKNVRYEDIKTLTEMI